MLAKFQPCRFFDKTLFFCGLFLAFILGEFHILLVPFSVETNLAMPVASLETKLAALTRQQVGNWESGRGRKFQTKSLRGGDS